uniref:Na(+)/H(+) exchange regulatory cofactor NHE-RF n=1 Tax=Hippocampus comes TaxID=109280 RepID=A0A3Q2ZNE2_HIPCM
MESVLRPRVCYLIKTERGYGFHLHGEKNKGGQFIRKVEPGSSADQAGLKPGDRLVEVNGENVESDNHHQVVERIREVPHRTRLLVVDRNTDDYLHSCGVACTEDLAIEIGTLSPRLSPRDTPSTSPLPRVNSPKSPQPDHTLLAANSFFLDNIGNIFLICFTQLQMKASPEPSTELLPRLCHLIKGEMGYGFNLHSNKAKGGQFVRSVDPHSPAERADVRPGDRLVEVNGMNIEHLRHSEVVAFIKAGEQEVRLLVVDQETDELFHRLGITPTACHVYFQFLVTKVLTLFVRYSGRSINACVKKRTAVEPVSSAPSPTSTEAPIIHVTLTDVPDEDDRRVLDPFMDSGLRLSPTAAEAKQKVLGRRNKKRAPPMDWNKKQEIFSNF